MVSPIPPFLTALCRKLLQDIRTSCTSDGRGYNKIPVLFYDFQVKSRGVLLTINTQRIPGSLWLRRPDGIHGCAGTVRRLLTDNPFPPDRFRGRCIRREKKRYKMRFNSSAVSIRYAGLRRCKNDLSRNPQETRITSIPALSAVFLSTSESPT